MILFWLDFLLFSLSLIIKAIAHTVWIYIVLLFFAPTAGAEFTMTLQELWLIILLEIK